MVTTLWRQSKQWGRHHQRGFRRRQDKGTRHRGAREGSLHVGSTRHASRDGTVPRNLQVHVVTRKCACRPKNGHFNCRISERRLTLRCNADRRRDVLYLHACVLRRHGNWPTFRPCARHPVTSNRYGREPTSEGSKHDHVIWSFGRQRGISRSPLGSTVARRGCDRCARSTNVRDRGDRLGPGDQRSLSCLG